jgi:SAM-dependent methyltransferase
MSSLNEQRVEQFTDQVVGVLNAGALALMTSIGHRSGLFDTLAELPPATSEEIARAAGLHERYVREWLAAMVVGGFVDYEEREKTYQLPAEHAAVLTREAAPNNLAIFGQHIALFGQVEDKILACFRHGGGLLYADYPRFHEVMAEDSDQTIVAGLLDQILPLVSGLRERLVVGMDVLDIGCGSGRAINKLAQTFPASRFVGYDLSKDAIDRAVREAEQLGAENVVFEVKDLTSLDEPAGYDLVTAFDAIHDQKDPARVLGAIYRALRPDGVFLMQDIRASSELHNNLDHPFAPLLYAMSCMHCTSVSLAQGGAGLGTMWGEEQALSMLAKAGFQARVSRLAHDPMNNYYIAANTPASCMNLSDA